MQLEKRLKGVAAEAKSNERAREDSQAQKDYAVGRLRSMVTHASDQNQQSRWNKETQAQEALKWAEQAIAFKSKAERLTELQNRSARKKDAMRQEAQNVFEKSKTDQRKHEAETV